MPGNKCGHNAKQPCLNPAHPIRKGQGGLPRILSLAAERAKEWYRHPQKCHVLNKGNRQTRSERREAYQIIIETMLSFLDLASLCLGTPTLDNGFVDIDMKALVDVSGLSQRRCERAIADLKEAELVEVKQPRKLNEHGEYVGLRAIRVMREAFFEFLDLGPMLRRERARATEALRRKAQRANRKLTDMMRRAIQGLKGAIGRFPYTQATQERHNVDTWRWNLVCAKYMRAGVPDNELRQRANAELGLPPNYSPGRA
jgi:hypothetical protein